MDKVTNFLVLGILLLSFSPTMGQAVNLAPNSGFEEASDNKIEKWETGKRILKGHVGIDSEIKHSGKNSLYIKSISNKLSSDSEHYGAISAFTDELPCPPEGSIIQCSVWVKTKDVVSPGKWFKARFVIYFFDKDNNKLKHYDIVTAEGTLDWKRYSTDVTVPKNAASMRLGCSLTNCSGEVWFDDIEIKISKNSLQRKKAMTNLPIGKPILIPTPWKTKFKNDKISVGNVLLKTISEDKILNPALEKILKERNIVILQENCVEIICADKTDKEVDLLFKKEFPDNNWDEMGNQGYFLNVGKNKIILAANSEQGRFYAMQTLRQLLQKSGSSKEIKAVTIIDKPTVDKRGVVIGLQWFREKEEAIRRMSRLKLNLVWHQGSFLNLKLGCSHKTLKTHWREPFTENEQKTIKNYLKLCRENFIEVCVAFSPRGLPQTHYCSEKDVDLLVAKMETLYQGGVRGLGIAFDDLQNIEQDKLFYKDDIDKFNNDLGEAHAYFVDQVFKKLKVKCPEVNFSVLPYAYGGFSKLPEEGKRSKKYLNSLSKISSGIKRWVVCLYSHDDVMGSKKLSGRNPFIWDNFYTTGQLAAFPAPIKRSCTLSNKNISGYMFLPAIPTQEDASKISWLNAADYEWAPSRYNSNDSYRRAIAFVAGSEKATKLLQKYSSFSLKIDDYNFPTENKEKRLGFLKKTLTELDSFPEQLNILEPKLAESLNKDILKYKKNLLRIVKNLNIRPFPALINKNSLVHKREGEKLDNFIPLKKVNSIADTKAWITYDKQNLYIQVICDEPETEKIVAKRKERDANIFQDDSIELFIMPEAEDATGNSTYYQIVINSIGSVYDSKYIHKRFNYLHDQFKDWTANLDIKTEVKQDSWTLNVAIPFKDLGMTPPENGKRIFVNICRNRYVGKKAEYSCYAMLLKGKFHDPLSFWPMEFKD